MSKEIMQCRNGCGSEYLDREYNSRFESNGKGLLITEYHCRNCEWRAVWDTKSKRLMINNDGKVEIQYSSDSVTAMIEAMDQADEDALKAQWDYHFPTDIKEEDLHAEANEI